MEPSEVSKTIGHDCKCEMVYDGSKLVIFMDSTGVVTSREEPYANLIFIDNYANGVVHVTKDRSLFEVRIAQVGNQTVYRLYAAAAAPDL